MELFPLRALCWGLSVHYLIQFCPVAVPHITEETVGLQGAESPCRKQLRQGSVPSGPTKEPMSPSLFLWKIRMLVFPVGLPKIIRQTNKQP